MNKPNPNGLHIVPSRTPTEDPAQPPPPHVCDGCPNVLDDCYPDSPSSCWMKPKP